MDDPVPTIDFSPSGSSDAAYSFEREDVDGNPVFGRFIRLFSFAFFLL